MDADRAPAHADSTLDQPRRRFGRWLLSGGGCLARLSLGQRCLGAAEFAAQVGDQRSQSRKVRRQDRHAQTPYCARRAAWHEGHVGDAPGPPYLQVGA